MAGSLMHHAAWVVALAGVAGCFFSPADRYRCRNHVDCLPDSVCGEDGWCQQGWSPASPGASSKGEASSWGGSSGATRSSSHAARSSSGITPPSSASLGPAGPTAFLQSPMPDNATRLCTNGSSAAPCPSRGDPYFGQDGCHDVHPPQYQAVEPDQVRDQVTGLVWEEVHSEQELRWPAAEAYCPGRTTGGHAWRLPNVMELVTLLDMGRARPPSVDTTVFPGTVGGWFWSSTPNAFVPVRVQAVSFANGGLVGKEQTDTAWVRCVR